MVYTVQDLDESLRELVQSGHRIDHIDKNDDGTWTIITIDDQLVTR